MNTTLPQPGELDNLLAALVDGELGEKQFSQLQQYLSEHPAAEVYYRRYMRLCAFLEFEHAAIKTDDGPDARDAAGNDRRGTDDELPAQLLPHNLGAFPTLPPSTMEPPVAPSLLPLFSTTLSDPVAYFSGWPVAYVVATVLLAAGLIAAHLTPKSYPVQTVQRSLPTRGRSLPGPEMQSVGRITGMVDCRFAAGSKTEGQRPKALVSIADKFVLLSGLLEITYDTGATVILQGPVTYQVESVAGGFLSLGKLTARVENTKTKDQRPKTEDPHPSSLIPHPLFVVRTPTATVTDLGTEFGVEVSSEGHTTSHVFRGAIELRIASVNGIAMGVARVLRENQSARVERTAAGLRLQEASIDGATFVRADRFAISAAQSGPNRFDRWEAHSRQLQADPALVAYYTFAPPANGDTGRLPNLSAAGRTLDGRVEGAEWVHGRLPGKYALYFHGRNSGDRVILPHEERFRFTGPFSVAVWFKLDRFAEQFQAIVAKGDRSWRIQRHRDTDLVTFDTNWMASSESLPSRTKVFDGRWHLAVATYRPVGKKAEMRFYLDGRLEAEKPNALPLEQTDAPVWIGADSTLSGLELYGLIDEVAILGRVLGSDEVEAMFRAGCPDNSRSKQDKENRATGQ
jgi:hypothetical protein